MTEDKDKYDEMTGPLLAEELARRELNVSGKVDELRARLREDDARRAQEGADESGEAYEGEETQDVPEPRQPVDHDARALVLTEEQARKLNAGTANVRRFTKHVTPVPEVKYAAGDRVMAIRHPLNSGYSVLPHGVWLDEDLTEQEDEG